MLSLNITIFEQNGEKYYFLNYSAWTKTGTRAYKITDHKSMLDNLKESLNDLEPSRLDIIVLTSNVNKDGHEEYNTIGMRALQELISKQFPNSGVIYDTTQSLNNIQ
jgi:hypothetical protein